MSSGVVQAKRNSEVRTANNEAYEIDEVSNTTA